MHHKEAYGANNLDTLLNLDDIWCNTPTYHDTDNMTFTPTTLARFEATFNDLNDHLAAASGQNYTNMNALSNEAAASQLWGATSSQGEDTEGEDSDGGESDWSAPSKKRKTTGGSIVGDQRVGSGEQKPPRKLPGPRPSRPYDQMTPLEMERRQRRRIRNKNAAAKCRQRRLEVTNELLQETEQLEKNSAQLQREIESLLRQKDQLQFVLDAHVATCRGIPAVPEHSIVNQSQPGVSHNSINHAIRPSSLQIPTTCGASVMPAISASLFSFDVTTSLTGLTPMLSAGDLSSPSSYILLSPSMLLAQ